MSEETTELVKLRMEIEELKKDVRELEYLGDILRKLAIKSNSLSESNPDLTFYALLMGVGIPVMDDMQFYIEDAAEVNKPIDELFSQFTHKYPEYHMYLTGILTLLNRKHLKAKGITCKYYDEVLNSPQGKANHPIAVNFKWEELV